MSTSSFQIMPADIMSHKTKTAIDKWLTKFPENQKQSAVLYALTVVQEENGGYLTDGLIEMVATYLGMPKIAAYEVATFYSMYELKPVGKYKICVCTNISCMLCGSEKIVQHLKNRLGIDFNETTLDQKFTLKEVECLAACGGAPAMQIGKHYYENLTEDRVDQILDSLE